jgi:hypothetical protein
MRASYAWAKANASSQDSKTELASSFSVDGRYDVIMVPSCKIVTAMTFFERIYSFERGRRSRLIAEKDSADSP